MATLSDWLAEGAIETTFDTHTATTTYWALGHAFSNRKDAVAYIIRKYDESEEGDTQNAHHHYDG